MGITPADGTNVQLDGSPIDAAFFAVLMIAASCVLICRRRRTLTLLGASSPILIYFLFCLLSVVWSDFPSVAFKRSIKAFGDVLMVLVILTDAQPRAALRRMFSRTGLILMPFSLLLIKYYPDLGRAFDRWVGVPTNTGVTANKNMLGMITLVLLLGTVWRVFALLWRDEMPAHRGRHLLAQGTLLVLGIFVLITSDSATSLVCFVLGTGLMLATRLQFIRRNPAAVHVLVLLLALTAGLAILLGGGAAAQALGRNATLTGRTDIWAAVITMHGNSFVGTGFESFWLSPRVAQRLAVLFPDLPLNEAHDGYIEVYLNLGLVGLSLIALILIDGYRRAVKAFRRDPALGGLILAYISAAIPYNVTEAGFRMLSPMWFFLLLSTMAASTATGGCEGAEDVFDSVRTMNAMSGPPRSGGERGRLLGVARAARIPVQHVPRIK